MTGWWLLALGIAIFLVGVLALDARWQGRRRRQRFDELDERRRQRASNEVEKQEDVQ